MTSIRFFDGWLVAAVFVAACGVETKPAAVVAIDAPVETAQASSLPETRITTGTVRSTTVSPLAAKVMGDVMRVHVVEGQRVRAGDLLIEIDDREGRAKTQQAAAGDREAGEAIAAADATVDAAVANAVLAEATYKRFAALRERGSASAQEFDEVAARKAGADAQLDQARRGREALMARRAQANAGLAEAQTFLSYSQVRAPISGIVTARMIDPGAQAAPGMPLLTVEDDSHYRVETTVDEQLASSVHAGDTVSVDGIAARVTTIVPAVDPATRSALVKIDLPPNSGLRSGSFVRVAFRAGERQGVTVPAEAVVRKGQLTSVLVVGKDGVARMRLVTLGEHHDRRVEVLSGLDAGETLVSRAVNGLRDGVAVRGRS